MSRPTISITNARLVRSRNVIRDIAEAANVCHAGPFPEPLSVPVPRPLPTLEVEQVLPKRRGRPRKIPQRTIPPRMQRMLTAEYRDSVRIELNRGRTFLDVAKTFGVSETTVRRISKETSPPKQRGGAVHVKLTAQDSVFLSERVLEDPTTTGAKLAGRLAERGVIVAPSTVNAHLRSSVMEEHGVPRFSVKRLHVHEEVRNSEDVKAQRR